jgi:hypothetical protein
VFVHLCRRPPLPHSPRRAPVPLRVPRRKDAQALAGEAAGKDIAYHLSGSFVSACDLRTALGRLFSAVAQGQVKPKTASTLAYLGQTLVQTLHIAQDEYINAYGTNSWRESIRISHQQSIDHFADNTSPDRESSDPEPEREPDPNQEPASEPASTPEATSVAPPTTPL